MQSVQKEELEIRSHRIRDQGNMQLMRGDSSMEERKTGTEVEENL